MAWQILGHHQQPPTITNLSTDSITSTSVNLKEITAKITITPAEENPVITVVLTQLEEEAFEAVIKSYKLSVEDEAKVREYVVGQVYSRCREPLQVPC